MPDVDGEKDNVVKAWSSSDTTRGPSTACVSAGAGAQSFPAVPSGYLSREAGRVALTF